MSEATLTAEFIGASAPSEGLFGTLLRWIREFIDKPDLDDPTAVRVRTVVGESGIVVIFDAADRDRVLEQIDLRAIHPAILSFQAEALAQVGDGDGAVTAASAFAGDGPPELVKLLGAGPARVFAEGVRFSLLGHTEFVRQLLLSGVSLTEIPIDPETFFFDPQVHPLVHQSLWSAQRSMVAFLAILEIVITRRSVDPWLRQALAEIFRTGAHESLRLFASIPESTIPEAMIPADERLDLDALEREVRTRSMEFERVVDRSNDD